MYRNFIDYPANKGKRVRMATGDETTPVTEQSWFQKNQKMLLIVGAVVLTGLILLPDALIRKYVPFVK